MIDDDILHSTPAEAFAAGAGAGVALVAGTTADEMRLFVDPTAASVPRDRFVPRGDRLVGQPAIQVIG